MKRESPPPRERFPYLAEMTTRWLDNDVYGHVNNVAYFSYFDSTVNRFLIERGGLDTRNGPTIGVIVESKCNYAQPLAYPRVSRSRGLRRTPGDAFSALRGRSLQEGLANGSRVGLPGSRLCRP